MDYETNLDYVWFIALEKYQSSVAKYAILKSSKINILLPSHSKEILTLAAFDNFDHKYRTSVSWLSSSHDTVPTLFQIKPIPSFSNKNYIKETKYMELMFW